MSNTTTDFFLKMLADTAGTPVDLLNLVGTTPVNAGRNFAAVLKGEKIPKPLEKLVETGSSEDLRKRMGVSTEDSLAEIIGMLAAPSVTSKATALPFLLGAFRNSGDSVLSRAMIDLLKKGKTERGLDAGRGYNEPFASSDLVLQAAASKLSDKELKKYGTPEFILDKYLPSTRSAEMPGRSPIPSGVFPISDQDIAKDKESLLLMNKARAEAIRSGSADTKLVPGPDKETSLDAYLTELFKKSDSLKIVEDFLDAKKTGKTLYNSNDPFTMKREIGKGIREMVNKARDLGIPEEDIAKKSLEQLTAVIRKKEDEALRILKKSAEAKEVAFRKRTAELIEKQRGEGLPEGFVRLEDPIDLSHETDMMNHCIGAVCRDKERYLPMHDVVTGELSKEGRKVLDNNTYTGTSFYQYNNALRDETSEFFSYRPDGKAAFTVEIGIDKKTGVKSLKQAYGPEDSDLTPSQMQKLQELLENRNVIDRGEVDDDLDFLGDWEAD